MERRSIHNFHATRCPRRLLLRLPFRLPWPPAPPCPPAPRCGRRAFLALGLRASAVALALALRRPGRGARAQPLPALQSGACWARVVAASGGLGLEAGRGEATLVRLGPLATVVQPAGERPLWPAGAALEGAALSLRGGDEAWALAAQLAAEPGLAGLFRLDLWLDHQGANPADIALRISAELVEGGIPSWMVPGAFYGAGPAPGYRGHPYPRFDPDGGDPDQLVSNTWAFRGDRASHPTVLAWTPRACVGLATEPQFGADLIGLEFGADRQRAWLGLNLPWKEAPRRYAFTPDGWGPPVAQTRVVQPGERLGLTCWLYLAAPEPHAYDPLLRWLYARLAPGSPLHPWFDRDTAAALAAGGIVRWHANPSARLLYETAWFTERPGQPRVDRAQQHVGWVSGVPTALALARYGRASGDARLEQIGLDVIDRIAREAPGAAGLLWADWVDGRGWGAGWSPRPDWIQARTVAEATLFLLRAAAEEAALGRPRPTWEAAAAGSLAFAVGVQRADGSFGAYYRAGDASVADWSGAAGLLWVAALAEAWQQHGDRRFLESAQRGGAYYADQVERGTLYGAAEDADLTPTSEDGYNALLAYAALAHADPANRARWLRLARRAVDWTMTFRFAYNVSFDPATPLGALGFATRGADLASPRNCHLHPYGLICLTELLELWEASRDAYYLERGRDLLLCFWQTLARFDGDFGAGQGMMTEQWYQTDWMAPKGQMLPLSHVWCLGMVLHGWWAVRRFGDLVLDGTTGRATLLAPGHLASPRQTLAGLALAIANPLDEPLRLRARLVDLPARAARVDGALTPLEQSDGRLFASFAVPAGQTVRLELSTS